MELVPRLTLTPENIAAITFDDVRKAKHLIGVRMPVPAGIEEFGDGVTLDSSTAFITFVLWCGRVWGD